MRRTKIICTLGPATDQGTVLEDMMRAGMNVARFNFSHGSHEEQKVRIDQVKAKGPEIRIKTFKEGRIELTTGDEFTLTTREVEGDRSIVSITYQGLPEDVTVGTRILIDDGLLGLEVLRIENGTDIVCSVQNDGPLSDRKSINIPGIQLRMPYLSEKDRNDIIFGIGEGIDFIAASFMRSADDARAIKEILKEQNAEYVQVIAKIENMEGVNKITEILHETDGIMVARGDLGVEVPYYELPEIQKMLIKSAISAGKLVVTATQMLESMAKNPRATRAEVSDVANAVFDGTSAIMLSGETSVGKYPLEDECHCTRDLHYVLRPWGSLHRSGHTVRRYGACGIGIPSGDADCRRDQFRTYLPSAVHPLGHPSVHRENGIFRHGTVYPGCTCGSHRRTGQDWRYDYGHGWYAGWTLLIHQYAAAGGHHAGLY